jgi:Tol biopolymer transport system component
VSRGRLFFLAGAAGAVLALGLAAYLVMARRDPLPSDATGTLVFVSDRDGQDALYVRRLPEGEARRLTVTGEPVRDVALAPDGSRLAFTMGGRIGLLPLPRGEVRLITLGVAERDAQPSWSPDGTRLVVSSRVGDARSADLVILDLEAPGGTPARTPVTDTRGLDETSPCFAPDGSHLVFVREDAVFRLSLSDGRAQRLTLGLRKYHGPRFLPGGRLLVLWSEGKRFGFEAMDLDGRNQEPLHEGTASYGSVAPSPDGRYLAATFVFDLAFRPADALRLKKAREVHLLDARGRFVGVLERAVRSESHSPQWGR